MIAPPQGTFITFIIIIIVIVIAVIINITTIIVVVVNVAITVQSSKSSENIKSQPISTKTTNILSTAEPQWSCTELLMSTCYSLQMVGVLSAGAESRLISKHVNSRYHANITMPSNPARESLCQATSGYLRSRFAGPVRLQPRQCGTNSGCSISNTILETGSESGRRRGRPLKKRLVDTASN